MAILKKTLFSWLPLAVAVTLVCGLIYVTVQQNYRQSLNDPQIQMAEDAAAALSRGQPATSVVPSLKVDMAQSLSPWVAVYDTDGNVLASSGELNGMAPKLPQGVFDTSTWHVFAEDGIRLTVPANENRFSWQPQGDVRQAVVLVQASNGDFAAAGRNMREVENREAALTVMVGIGWLVTVVATLLVQLVAGYVVAP